MPRLLKQVQRPVDICLGIELRIFQRWPNARARCQMNDGIKLGLVEDSARADWSRISASIKFVGGMRL